MVVVLVRSSEAARTLELLCACHAGYDIQPLTRGAMAASIAASVGYIGVVLVVSFGSVVS